MSFRISPALWDKIQHFASFPQTGGVCFFCLIFRWNESSMNWLTLFSVAAADGFVWSEPLSGNAIQSESVSRGYVYFYGITVIWILMNRLSCCDVQKSCLFVLLTGSRSSIRSRTISAPCLRLIKWRIGMLSRLRYFFAWFFILYFDWHFLYAGAHHFSSLEAPSSSKGRFARDR